MAISPQLHHIERLGGHLVLDFVNTVHHRFESVLRDYLHGYEDLVYWGGIAGLLSEPEARALMSVAAELPRDAESAFRDALALREALHGSMLALIAGREPGTKDTATLNSAFSEALSRRKLVWQAGRLVWRWPAGGRSLARAWWPMAAAAAELLTSDHVDRIKHCPHPEGCGWLFLDLSKNHSRRWCSMRLCGNLAKVKRHYRKKRARDGGR